MKKTALSIGIAAAFMIGGSSAMAGEVSGLVNFEAETTAKASEVNGNFAAVKTAVDENDARITSNAAAIEAIDTSGIATNAAAIAAIDTSTNASDIGALETSVYGVGGTPVTPTAPSLLDDVATLKAGGGCPDEMASVGSICVDKNDTGRDEGYTWVQAQQACVDAGKRLLTNAEWTLATFYISSEGITGMADGYYEWTADWTSATARLLRGDKTGGTDGGVDAYIPWDPANTAGASNRGFRCAK